MLSGCVTAPPQTTTAPGTAAPTTLPDFDLTDPALQAELGSPAPEDIDWSRRVGGLAVVGRRTLADPAELELIEAALAEVPRALAAAVTPRTLVRVPEMPDSEELHPRAITYTQGPDVYLLDRTLAPDGTPISRFDLARAYLHELAHVAQFLTLRTDYVAAALAGDVDRVDPAEGSQLVLDFAAATGWDNRSGDPLQPEWVLPAGRQAATEYGAEGPGEDMAEAVALVALGRADWIPADRARWVERWLDETAETLGAGKPWAPHGSVEVLSREPIYEENELEPHAVRFDHAEAMYFSLPESAAAHQELAAEIELRLLTRRLAGALRRADDDRLPRYSGLFSRTDGVAFWVELWDFREATRFRGAPRSPVLTYVVLW